MVYCIIAYVSPEWSGKFNFVKKKNVTELEYLRLILTK
jgi:hypothetical protein